MANNNSDRVIDGIIAVGVMFLIIAGSYIIINSFIVVNEIDQSNDFCESKGFDYAPYNARYSPQFGKVKCVSKYDGETITKEFNVYETGWGKLKEVEKNE